MSQMAPEAAPSTELGTAPALPAGPQPGEVIVTSGLLEDL